MYTSSQCSYFCTQCLLIWTPINKLFFSGWQNGRWNNCDLDALNDACKVEVAYDQVPVSSAEPCLSSFAPLSEICPSMSNGNSMEDNHQANPGIGMPMQGLPKRTGFDVVPCPDRDSVISRYKAKRKTRRWDMDMPWHDSCFPWQGAVTSNVHNCAAMELLQIWQAGPVRVAQSSCWWQAQDQGAFCKGKPDMNLNLQYAKHLPARRRKLIRGDSAIIMHKCARILFAFSSIADNHSFIYSGMMCVYCCHVTSGYTTLRDQTPVYSPTPT